EQQEDRAINHQEKRHAARRRGGQRQQRGYRGHGRRGGDTLRWAEWKAARVFVLLRHGGCSGSWCREARSGVRRGSPRLVPKVLLGNAPPRSSASRDRVRTGPTPF